MKKLSGCLWYVHTEKCFKLFSFQQLILHQQSNIKKKKKTFVKTPENCLSQSTDVTYFSNYYGFYSASLLNSLLCLLWKDSQVLLLSYFIFMINRNNNPEVIWRLQSLLNLFYLSSSGSCIQLPAYFHTWEKVVQCGWRVWVTPLTPPLIWQHFSAPLGWWCFITNREQMTAGLQRVVFHGLCGMPAHYLFTE